MKKIYKYILFLQFQFIKCKLPSNIKVAWCMSSAESYDLGVNHQWQEKKGLGGNTCLSAALERPTAEEAVTSRKQGNTQD